MTPEEEPKEITLTIEIQYGDRFEESKDGSLSCHTPTLSELGKSAQLAGLYRSPLVQAWAALAREEEKKRLDQRAREQL